MEIFEKDGWYGVKDGEKTIVPPIFTECMRLEGNRVYLLENKPNSLESECWFDISYAKYIPEVLDKEITKIPVFINDNRYLYRVESKRDGENITYKTMFKSETDEILLHETSINFHPTKEILDSDCRKLENMVIETLKKSREYITNLEIPANVHFLLSIAMSYFNFKHI